MTVIVEPHQYVVTDDRLDPVDQQVWQIQISRRGEHPSPWAVTRFNRCLNAAGDWTLEPEVSSRTADFIRTHRFPLDEAIRLAVAAYPSLVINGMWVRDGQLVKAELP